MISRQVRLTALLAVAFVTALVAQPTVAAAQTDPIGILKQLPGLNTAYARKYVSADHAPRGVTTPVPVHRDLVVTATVLKFNSAFSLALAKRLFLNDAAIRQMLGEPTGTITKSDATAVGANAEIYLVRTDIGDGRAHALLIAHHGDLAFLIRADGPERELKPALLAFGKYMTGAKPGTGKVVLRKTGSTGGLWNLFPTKRQFLQDMVPMYDYDLLGPSGESPIGSATPVS